MFQSARHFAVWPGLVPRQHSTGGKTRPGRITKAGNREIGRLPVLGATSMVHRAAGWNSAAGAWTRGALQRRPVRLVTVALANKMACIAWALMTRRKIYHAKGRPAARRQRRQRVKHNTQAIALGLRRACLTWATSARSLGAKLRRSE